MHRTLAMTAVVLGMALVCPKQADADSPVQRSTYAHAVAMARSAGSSWYARRLPITAPHELPRHHHVRAREPARPLLLTLRPPESPLLRAGTLDMGHGAGPVVLRTSLLDPDPEPFTETGSAGSARLAPAFVASVLEAPVTPSINFGYRVIGGDGAVIVGVRGSF